MKVNFFAMNIIRFDLAHPLTLLFGVRNSIHFHSPGGDVVDARNTKRHIHAK